MGNHTLAHFFTFFLDGGNFDSHSNFEQSNDWQKVQYNTDLLIPRHGYLYRAKWCWLKEILIQKSDY